MCLPHARGGVSHHKQVLAAVQASSPRPWGCFYSGMGAVIIELVFPTPVGVFPFLSHAQAAALCLPHARGGVSGAVPILLTQIRSSPRPWGCFRSTSGYTGAIKRLPHARGGVSASGRGLRAVVLSSPRPWGCFLRRSRLAALMRVFPTPVGVFPSNTLSRRPLNGLPHARGGVSIYLRGGRLPASSSPRPWGCFYDG